MFALSQKPVLVKFTDPIVIEKLGTDEVTVTIQKLSGRSLRRARIQNQITQAAPLKAMGGQLVRELQKPSEALDEAAKALADKKATAEGRRDLRRGQYDPDAILNAGIVRWSCEDVFPLDTEHRDASLSLLDEPTSKLLFNEIVDFSDPDPEVTAAEGKDSSSSSTTS